MFHLFLFSVYKVLGFFKVFVLVFLDVSCIGLCGLFGRCFRPCLCSLCAFQVSFLQAKKIF